MKRCKTILVLSILIVSVGYSNVQGMIACFERCLSCCRANKKLKKSDINALDSHGYTRLNRALMELQFVKAQRLLSAGADPSIQSGDNKWTALHWAVFWGQDGMVETIMQTHGELMDVPDADGKTPSMLVAERKAHIQKSWNLKVIGNDIRDNDNKCTDRMIVFLTSDKKSR